jgi:hypothetical protein
MKKFVLAIVILISFNSFLQTKKKDKKVELILVSTYTLPESQRTYKKGEVISSQTWTTGAWVYDSIEDRIDQIKSVNELNKIRKKAGKPLLKWDDRLQPAALHHVTYMRYCKKHHLINDPDGVEKDTIKFKDYSFMSHKQIFDIPNFKEIVWPDWRISLLDGDVFSEMTEELGGGGNVMGYNWCKYHWAALNDAKWDAVYSYWDPVIKINITILASYKKSPIKK